MLARRPTACPGRHALRKWRWGAEMVKWERGDGLGDGRGESGGVGFLAGAKLDSGGTPEGKRWEWEDEGGECGCGGAEVREGSGVGGGSGDQGLQRGEGERALRRASTVVRLAAGFVVGGSGSGWSRDMAQC